MRGDIVLLLSGISFLISSLITGEGVLFATGFILIGQAIAVAEITKDKGKGE